MESEKSEENENINPKITEANNIKNNKQYLIIYIIIAVLLFAFIIRTYYLIETKDQLVWWDEAEYLVKAKSLAFGTSDEGWNPLRELFMSFFWALLYKLGATEIVIKISSLLIALLSIYLTYLVGKEIFNKYIGLIAALIMATLNQHIFFSLRMLVDIPASVFWLSSIYFFWKGYVKDNNTKYLVLSGVFLGIGFLTHYSLLFLLIAYAIFIIITKNIKFVKEKNIWITLATIIMLAGPYIIWSLIKYGTPLPRYAAAFVSAETQEFVPSAWNVYIKFLPLHLEISLLVMFVIGLILALVNVILSLDFILKGKDKSMYKYLLLLLWILVPFFIYTYASIESGGHAEPRYLILMLPQISIIAAIGLDKTFSFIKTKSKPTAIAVLLLILIFSIFIQIKTADSLIKSKLSPEFNEFKNAAFYIKDHSDQTNTVIINSMQMELAYYSERRIIGFGANEENLIKTINEQKPKYVMLNALYQSEQWMYEFPSKHTDLLELEQAYFKDESKSQPIAAIFKVNN